MTTAMVLGAGMVGVSTALALREAGFDVVLVDRGDPGVETSFGNAGVIQAEAVEPYALPRDLRSLLRIAFRRGNDVNYHIDALPGHALALWQYFRASRPDRHRAISVDYARMIRQATTDHQDLISAAGVDNLIRRDGFYEVFRSDEALGKAARKAAALSDRFGVGLQVLDGAALGRVEPALKPGLSGALRWTDSWTCLDPGALVAAYARLLLRRGGQILTGDAMTLRRAGAGWSVTTEAGQIEARHAVVSLGPWSPDLLARFGHRIRMVYKRGYHRHVANAGGLRITMLDAENGMVLAPMATGLRITTGAEIARDEAPPTPRQLDHALRAAESLVDIGPALDAGPWMGRRPCLPGMLPFVGRMPGETTLWGNFGHGHQGFTLGPTTGRILVRLMGTPPGQEHGEAPDLPR